MGIPETGRREQKKEETRRRIAETGLRLFIEKGFEETTLDEVAEAAGISRRTFFYYFKTKDDLLTWWHGNGFATQLAPALSAAPKEPGPLAALRRSLVELAGLYETPESIAVDRLMRSSDVLYARKQASMVKLEQDMLAALRERWPEFERELPTIAVIAMGVLRISLEKWREEEGRRPMASYIDESFEILGSVLPAPRD